MDSGDSLIIPVHSSEGSIGEEESSQLNSEHKHMENVERAKDRAFSLIQSLEEELEFNYIPSTDVKHLPKFRVPDHIKQSNPDAYKPRLISVGPVHHGKPELQPMEAFKRSYFRSFFRRQPISIEKVIEVTKKNEEALRENYGITSQEIPSDEFVKIMIIDVTFLVDFLLTVSHPRPFNEKWNNVISDLFLLENQIPFYYLSDLLALTKRQDMWVLDFCDDFLDNVRPFDIGTRKNNPPRRESHLLDRLRTRMAHTTNEEGPFRIPFDPCPTISQLHRAGIKFRPSTKILRELIFQQGTLKIPRFVIDHNTGRYFANLLASELFANDFYANDYIAIMDYLIDGPEDVRILVERGILENHLGDDKAAASLINEIGKSIDFDRDFRRDFRYKPLVENLNAHCKKAWVTWRARYLFDWKRELKSNYFGNPWKIVSVTAAVILLGLTVTQTVFSFLQLKGF